MIASSMPLRSLLSAKHAECVSAYPNHFAVAHADWAAQTAGARANAGPAPGALAGASMGADVGHDHIDFAPMHFAHMWD